MTTINEAPRDVRRRVFSIEKRERASGKWGRWEIINTGGIPGAHGWLRDVRHIYRNDWCVVLIRPNIRSSLGEITHLAIRTAMQTELGWAELQRIKDEIYGTDRMAVQVYPRAADTIDEADVYHLWVFPAGARFDFGLAPDQF